MYLGSILNNVNISLQLNLKHSDRAMGDHDASMWKVLMFMASVRMTYSITVC